MNASRSPVTVPQVAASKACHGSAPLVMVTAYDYHSARLADRAGVDLLLVGDSLEPVDHLPVAGEIALQLLDDPALLRVVLACELGRLRGQRRPVHHRGQDPRQGRPHG